MNYLPCEIVETQDKVNAAVIWLHGLGASGHDFVPIVPHLKMPDHLGVRFVFPHAPVIPVTVNGGMEMPAWYDILAMDMEREIDTQQIMASSNAVVDLIEREIANGISSERIVLAGFSQGGAVVYQTALSFEKPLAGLMAMSTYFATHKTIKLSKENAEIPIQVFHGSNDPMVPLQMATHALESLKALGHQAAFKTYPMEHEICMEEIDDIAIFLKNALT